MSNWNVPTLKERVEAIVNPNHDDESLAGIIAKTYVDVSYATHDGRQCSRAESESYLSVGFMTDNTGYIESIKELAGFLKFTRLDKTESSIIARALFTREQRFHN